MRNVALASILMVGCSVLVAGCLADADNDVATAQEDDVAADIPSAHVHWQRGQAPQQQAGSTSNLIDHGGRVLPVSNTYAIWWGTQSSFPSDAQSGIDTLFQGLNGTSFLAVANQYMRGSTATTSFHTNLVDTSAPPSRGPSTTTIASEACKVIQANGLTPDPNAIYFVFTSNFPGGHVNYCAWHSYGTCNGTTIQVAYMPNVTGMAGCDPGNTYNCNSYSQGTRALANVTSHEYMEAITDADPGSSTGAWTDSSGSEIGDKCAWQFSSCVSLNNSKWQLQEEWSNSASGCVQQ
jgi:hypothetical protein